MRTPDFTIETTSHDAARRDINRSLAAIIIALAFTATALGIKLYDMWEATYGRF